MQVLAIGPDCLHRMRAARYRGQFHQPGEGWLDDRHPFRNQNRKARRDCGIAHRCPDDPHHNLSSLLAAVPNGKRHRTGRNTLHSNKEDSFLNRIYSKRSACGALLSFDCEGFPSRSPVRHVAGVQDFACTPSNSLSCRRRLKRCPRFAAGTLDPDVYVPSSICPVNIARNHDSRASPTGQFRHRT